MTIESLFEFLQKSHIQASEGKKDGLYPFYTSSDTKKLYLDTYIYDCEAVILGTGGSPSCNYCNGKFSTSTDNFVLKATATVLPKFLYYYLRNDNFRILSKGFKGAGLKHISKEYIKKIDVPVLPIEQQTKIINVLDTIHAALENTSNRLNLYDELIKSRFIELFGDTVTNSLGWEEHRLDEYINFLTSGSRGWSQYFIDQEGELFITIKNVKNNHITLENIQYIDAPNNKEAERTKVKKDDLLISITADLGRTGVVDSSIAEKGAYINQHLSLVRLNAEKINPLYVSYFLETEGGKIQFASKNQNGVKAGLNFDAIKSLKILVPPLEMQEAYVNFVEQTDKSKLAVQRTIDLLTELLNTKMDEYFSN